MLLDSSNSEPCISNLLSVFDPIKSDNKKYAVHIAALDFAKAYIKSPDEVNKLVTENLTRSGDKNFSQRYVDQQIESKIHLFQSVENFLLSTFNGSDGAISVPDVNHLAEGTLAFFLADEQKKVQICELFQLLAANMSSSITDPSRRKRYGRTLFGIRSAQDIDDWVQANADNLRSMVDDNSLLDIIWPLLTQHIESGTFTKFDNPNVCKEIAFGWICGKTFHSLLAIIHNSNTKLLSGSRRKEFTIDDVVDVCEHSLAYDGALTVGAVSEFVENLTPRSDGHVINRLQLFQKRLKYGLPTETTIAIYELGFSDRVIAQDLAMSLNFMSIRKSDIVNALKNNRDRANLIIGKYPRYFQETMNDLLK
jgi:hypothetical protein